MGTDILCLDHCKISFGSDQCKNISGYKINQTTHLFVAYVAT